MINFIKFIKSDKNVEMEIEYEEDSAKNNDCNQNNNYNEVCTIGNLLLKHLFSFLENEKFICDTSFNYFQKIIFALLNKKGLEVLSFLISFRKY